MPISEETRKLPAVTPDTISQPEPVRRITTRLPPARALGAAQQPTVRKIYSGWSPPVRAQVAEGPNEMVGAGERGPLLGAAPTPPPAATAADVAALRAEIAALRAERAVQGTPQDPAPGAPAETDPPALETEPLADDTQETEPPAGRRTRSGH